MAQLPFVGVDMELAKLAASLKAQHNLPYADCFAAARASTNRQALDSPRSGDSPRRQRRVAVELLSIDNRQSAIGNPKGPLR